MLLITGMQRCGTSLTADFVRACGYPMTGPNDAVGKYEDPEITMAYRYILKDEMFPWDGYPFYIPKHLSQPLHDIERPAAKFAYLMMDPVFMQIWIEHRGHKHDRMLILARETEKIVRSKANTPERARLFALDSHRLRLTAEQLKQNWFDSFMLLLNSGIPYRVLKFPIFLDDYDAVRGALQEFGGLEKIPNDAALWRTMIDRKKVTAET
jgi:hypothetical protein